MFGSIFQCLALTSAIVLLQTEKVKGDYQIPVSKDANVYIEERDALYPISRYAGMGYNLLRGNPEGDFDIGGKDPGIQGTRWIFNLTYTMNKEGHYKGITVAVPDQVEFQPRWTCASRLLTKAYSGQTSYQWELARNVNIGISGSILGIINAGFSLSTGMQEVEKRTKDSGEIIIQKTKVCNLGSVRYKDELIVDNNMSPYVLSEGFKNAVMKLPDQYNNGAAETAYLRFIERWGTHVILSAEVGTRWIERQSATYSDVYSFLSKQEHSGASYSDGFTFFGVGASQGIGINLKTLNRNIDAQTEFGHSKSTLTIGTTDNPAPIHLELMPLFKVVDKNMWGSAWDENVMASKKKNLIRALELYPNQTDAHLEKDPMIFIRPELNWLSGIFASPMPREGCSTGFSRGCVKQKTYDLFNYANSWSTSISNRLSCKVNTGYITTCFCVKVARKLKQNEFAWPSGSYCIARKKAFCPAGFRQGSIKWDDKDIFNNNEHWGELPDGEYNKDTKIFFCCRSDGSYKIPIRMPVGMPFVLYRYGGHCQKVMNMSVQEDYIKWVGELVSFIWDKRSGNHPDDDGGSKNYLLHYCHYSNS